MSSSGDKLMREAKARAEKKLSEQKVTALNSRGPKEEPVGKPLPQPDQVLGAPPRKE